MVDWRSRLRALAVGAVVGFGGCSVAGHLVPETMEPFTRFHLFVAPDTFYYPTVRSVWNMVLGRADRNKTMVIVGGSSVLYGAGQPEGRTFSDFLADELGDRYTVINLAMRGGDVAGMALFVAQGLKADGYDVVYMADVFVGGTSPIGSNPYYEYIYWQYRGESFSQDWAPRAAFAEARSWSELAFSAKLNTIFRFNNLWNYIGYHYVFTLYTPYAPQFWQPRRDYHDNETEWPPGAPYTRADHRIDLAMLEAMSATPTEGQWNNTMSSWRDTVPDSLKPTTFFVLCRKSPYLIGLLPTETAARLNAEYEDAVIRAARSGLHGIAPCGDFAPDDYVDTTHLSIPGARKLAKKMAPMIKLLGVKS